MRNAGYCCQVGRLSVADVDDDVGPLRADWRIWLLPEYDPVPERAVFCRAIR